MFPVLISPGMPWAQPCHVKVIAVAATVLELTVEVQTSGKVRKLQEVRRTLPIAPLKAFNSGRWFFRTTFQSRKCNVVGVPAAIRTQALLSIRLSPRHSMSS